MKKHPQKQIGYFSKIAEIFSTAKTGQVCPDSFFNVSYKYLIQIFDVM